MTSEVLMLNKDAVVIAADSAVTTGRAPHPRYSKSANKIFDLSVHGNVALTIYANADIDRVPWELAIKLFRSSDAHVAQRPNLADYQTALLGYLQGNTSLFPLGLRNDLLKRRLSAAAVYVLEQVEAIEPVFGDTSAATTDRKTAWLSGSSHLSLEFGTKGIQTPLTNADLVAAQSEGAEVQAELTPLLAANAKFLHADPAYLVQLAIAALLKTPTEFLPSTGVVIAGYGEEEIFPSFKHLRVYGHIGGTLLWAKDNDYAINHDNAAWIQPFAQSSMIERFTDGFDETLTRINHMCSSTLIDDVFGDLQRAGIVIEQSVTNAIKSQRHSEFMKSFRDGNWNENFYPLRRVLNSLSVPEMGHLAESLLVLEALRERVTSPSESIGGPIDVAVITKTEGLIWLKRKHFFDPALNMRYLNRSKIH